MRSIRLLSVALLLAGPARAQAPEEAPMTLDECLRLTLERNPDIAVARKDTMAADHVHEAAHGIFDPLLLVGLERSESDSPSVSQLTGAEVLQQERLSLSAGVTEALPWGGSATFSLTGDRSESNSTFSSLNPAYNTGISLSLTQPLLRGFGSLPTRYQIHVTKIGEKQAGHRELLQVVATIQSVENAYWDLVLAKDDLDVKRQSLKVAQDLLSQNKIRVEVGTLAPIELVQAEAGVALRDQAIIAADALLKDTEELLKRLMGVPPGDPLWSRTIRPTDKPASPELPGSLDAALRTAREARRELMVAREDLEVRQLTTSLRRSQVRPALDATLGYASNGVGGDAIIYDPNTNQPIGTVPGGLSDAFDQSTGLDYPAWSAGLRLSFPVLNRAATNDYAVARLDEEKGAIQLRRAELDVETDVRAAFRAVETARKGVEASRANERAQAKKLEAEQKKFENGLSTSFQVLEFDEDLSQARSDLRRAETGVHKATLNLLRAIGKLLEAKGIQVAE